MSKVYKVTDFRPECEPGKEIVFIRFQRDVAVRIGRSRNAIWKQFKAKGYYKSKDFKVEKETIL